MSYIKVDNNYFTKNNDLIRRMQSLQENHYYLSKINNNVSYTKYKYSKHGDPKNGIYSIGYFKESDPMPGDSRFFDEKYWELYESLPIVISNEDPRGRIYFMPNADYEMKQLDAGHGHALRIEVIFYITKEYVIEHSVTADRGSFDLITIDEINPQGAEHPVAKITYEILKINPSGENEDPRNILSYK